MMLQPQTTAGWVPQKQTQPVSQVKHLEWCTVYQNMVYFGPTRVEAAHSVFFFFLKYVLYIVVKHSDVCMNIRPLLFCMLLCLWIIRVRYTITTPYSTRTFDFPLYGEWNYGLHLSLGSHSSLKLYTIGQWSMLQYTLLTLLRSKIGNKSRRWSDPIRKYHIMWFQKLSVSPLFVSWINLRSVQENNVNTL